MENRKATTFTWIYLIAVVLSLVIIAIGAFHHPGERDWNLIAIGMLGLVATCVTWPLCEVLSDRSAPSAVPASEPVMERLQQIAVMLNTISEQQLVSDRARAIAFREKDRELLRRAIQEELSRQDWDAVLALANDIEREFGYKAEADRFRQAVNDRKQEAVRRQVQEAVAIIDRHTRSEQWSAALREADRLRGMFPDNEQVKNLPIEIEARRQDHKKRLYDSWNDAVARHDVDGSIEILKQLDTYLTPAEAEGMQETARQMFKEKLNIFSTQFKDAVTNRNWLEAIRVGETIRREYPNTRMAQEVGEKMETLKQKASEPASPPAPVAPAPPPVPAA